MNPQPDFLRKSLSDMTSDEWESLCDGCGLCCLHRANHPDTGEDMRTNIACRALDCDTLSCQQYDTRLQNIPHCLKLTPDNIATIDYLPRSCAYRLVYEKKPLPEWHYLICGDRRQVHLHGISKKGTLLREAELIEWLENGKTTALAVEFYKI